MSTGDPHRMKPSQRSSSTSVDGSSRRSSSGSVDGSLTCSSSGSVVSLLSGGSSTIASPTNLFRESMPLDDDVVPPHRPIIPSVTMPILLKRLLPEDIVELSAGASIIIVIPPTSRATSSVVRARRQYYSRAFDHVIKASSAWMRDPHAPEHYIEECTRSHRLQRNGARRDCTAVSCTCLELC